MIGIILLITLLIGLLALVVVLIYSRQSEVELTDRSVDLGDVLAHPDHHRRCDYQRQRGHYGRVSAVSAGGLHPFGE